MKYKNDAREPRTRKLEGFAITLPDGQLGYDGYSYFTVSREMAEDILADVEDEFPDLTIVPATLEYSY